MIQLGARRGARLGVAHRALFERETRALHRALVARRELGVIRGTGVGGCEKRLGVRRLALLDGFAALALRHALPRGGDRGNRPGVDRGDVLRRHGGERGAVEDVGTHPLGAAPIEEQLDERVEPRDELRSKLRPGHGVQVPELFLVVHRADEREALALGEEPADGLADGVLRDGAGRSPVDCRDVSQRRLEVVRGGDATAAVRVVQVEVKVPEEPHERRREGAELADAAAARGGGASLGPDADVLGHLGDEGEAIERGFVDAAHLVVAEQGR